MADSRYIPKDVSDAVCNQHFFECAWCGTKLTERHHIEHYALGGIHSISNLILLCPNCHTQVHYGKISNYDLRNRKSTHLKGDRIEGTFSIHMQKPVFRLGGVRLVDTPVLLILNGENAISWIKDRANDILLSIRLYDENGDLVFWMADNRYWAPRRFRILSEFDNIHISCNGTRFFNIKISQVNNELHINGLFFFNGEPIVLSVNDIQYKSLLLHDIYVNNCASGIRLGRGFGLG